MVTGRGPDQKRRPRHDQRARRGLVRRDAARWRASLGEKDFTALFHQGSSDNIQLSLVGDRALLTALFDDTTTVGMVRLYATEAAKRLTTIFRKKQEGGDRAGPPRRAWTARPSPEGTTGALDNCSGRSPATRDDQSVGAALARASGRAGQNRQP